MPWASEDSRVPSPTRPAKPPERRPEMAYLRAATRPTDADADRTESAICAYCNQLVTVCWLHPVAITAADGHAALRQSSQNWGNDRQGEYENMTHLLKAILHGDYTGVAGARRSGQASGGRRLAHSNPDRRECQRPRTGCGAAVRPREGIFCSVVPRVGVRTRSDQSVTSVVSLLVVHVSSGNRKVVRQYGSPRGSTGKCSTGIGWWLHKQDDSNAARTIQFRLLCLVAFHRVRLTNRFTDRVVNLRECRQVGRFIGLPASGPDGFGQPPDRAHARTLLLTEAREGVIYSLVTSKVSIWSCIFLRRPPCQMARIPPRGS